MGLLSIFMPLHLADSTRLVEPIVLKSFFESIRDLVPTVLALLILGGTSHVKAFVAADCIQQAEPFAGIRIAGIRYANL